MRADSLSLTEEVFQLSTSTSRGVSLSSRYVRVNLCFRSQVEWTREALTQKKARFPSSGLNSGSSFISQDEDMSESRVETLEKAVGVSVIWTGGLTSL